MKLIMTKGLPGSGKTTWAKGHQTLHDSKRVNKDDLRAMLDNGKWSKHNEALVLEARNWLINRMLKDGKDVIVDDTNLAPKHEETLKRIATECGAEFEVMDFTNVSLETCIVRDVGREKPVGAKVITDMYNQYLRQPPVIEKPVWNEKLSTVVIFDMDGTLALIKDRSPYDTAKCYQDEVNEPVAHLASMYREIGFRVLIVSGREEKHREVTQRWLDDHNIDHDGMFMRPTGDFRKDCMVKEEIYTNHILNIYNVAAVFDDRNQVVDMWRSHGLQCFQVAYGDF